MDTLGCLDVLIGIDVYAAYGLKHSKLAGHSRERIGINILNITGIGLCILLLIVGMWHQQSVGWEEDKTLLTVSVVFSTIHLVYYGIKISKRNKGIL